MNNCINCNNSALHIGGLGKNDRNNTPIIIDACDACQLFWLDMNEEMIDQLPLIELSGRIASISTLPMAWQPVLSCPVCEATLLRIVDAYTERKSEYHICPADHGMCISYADFLRFKGMNTATLDEVRQSRTFPLSCRACGGALSLTSWGLCAYCQTDNRAQTHVPVELGNIQENIAKMAEEIREENRQNASCEPLMKSLPPKTAMDRFFEFFRS